MATEKKAPAPPAAAPPAAAPLVEPVDPADIIPIRPERPPLTPERIVELSAVYRDVVLQDDEEAKQLQRRIASELRRASHDEVHPNCPWVELDVPPLRVGDVRINNMSYRGRVRVRRCTAQTILRLVYEARLIESQRMDDGKERHGATMDLDQGLAERMRIIQEA